MDVTGEHLALGWADELEGPVPLRECFVEIHMNLPVLCVLEDGVDAPRSFVRERHRIAKLFVHLFCQTFVKAEFYRLFGDLHLILIYSVLCFEV